MLLVVNFYQSKWSQCPYEWFSVENIIILSSFEKEGLVCYIFVFLGKRQSPELQLFRKKAGKTEGSTSIMRLTHYRFSGVQSEICGQVLSRPSWDGHYWRGYHLWPHMQRQHYSGIEMEFHCSIYWTRLPWNHGLTKQLLTGLTYMGHQCTCT